MSGLPGNRLEAAIRRRWGAGNDARPFGSIEWTAGAELSAAMAVFDAGGANEEHTHPDCEELVYVLDGEIEHTLGDESTVLRAGDVIIVPRDAPHRLINRGGRACRMVIVFSNVERTFLPTGR